MKPRTAVILAAGGGARLASIWRGRCKGFIEVDGQPLVARSVGLLRAQGLARIVIVAGYAAHEYLSWAESEPGVEVVINEAWAESGSMGSLCRGLAVVNEDLLLLESDLYYEPRALSALLAHPGRDAVLASSATGAGDEVWVASHAGRVTALSKDRRRIPRPAGEFVGISRITAELARTMVACSQEIVRTHGSGCVDYDTGALHAAVARHPVSLCLVPDLLWGEVDDETQYRRVVTQVAPGVRAADIRREPASSRPPI